MRRSTVALVVAALLALLATACRSGDGGDGGGAGVPQTTVPPGAVGSQHVLGSPQAPIELIEYADFQ
jgi:hypothetical protein